VALTDDLVDAVNLILQRLDRIADTLDRIAAALEERRPDLDAV
jgi:hypothetical protein